MIQKTWIQILNQNSTSGPVAFSPPLRKISSKFVRNFLSYPAYKQTNGQTPRSVTSVFFGGVDKNLSHATRNYTSRMRGCALQTVVLTCFDVPVAADWRALASCKLLP